MIIKYCNNCVGKPYTTEFDISVCPKCGTPLSVESVSEDTLQNRPKLGVAGSAPKPFDPFNQNGKGSNTDNKGSNNNYNPFATPADTCNEQPPSATPDVAPTPFGYTPVSGSAPVSDSNKTIANKNVTTVRGRISQYSSTGNEDGNYRRLFFIRWYQAIVYRQRLEDVLHRFTVRVDDSGDGLGYQGYRDVPVNVHGTISGGLQLADNMEVEVSGKYDKGVLMASSINVVNNGCKSKVTFQRSIKAITYGILFGILLILLCVLGANSTQGFWQGIGSFLKTWAVFAAILSVLYLITSFSRLGILFRIFRKKGVSFPLLGILLVSLALSFLFLYIFGSFAEFGSVVASWVYAAVPIIVIIIALFFLIKGMF